MSDTPRTDAAKTFKVHAGCPELVSKDFARQLERENAELRKDKERLDKRNSNLVATCVMLQFELKKEVARLDWLLGDEPIYSNYRKVAVNNRDDIDAAMKEEL